MTSATANSIPLVYVLDGEGNARNWSVLLPGHSTLNWHVGIGGRPGAFHPIHPPSGSVVVCHQLSDPARAAVTALSRTGVHVVHVSLAEGDGLRDDGTYERGLPVAKAHDDMLFARCFALFLRDLAITGRPKWELLEGVVPENVLAYHLCGLLEQSEAMRLREELRGAAEAEGALMAELSATGRGTWSKEVLDDRDRLRDFLRKHA